MNIKKKILIILAGFGLLVGSGATLMAQSKPNTPPQGSVSPKGGDAKKGKRCEICSRNEKTGQMECRPAPCP